DGAGNVAKMGNSYFVYDHVSRVIDGHVAPGPVSDGTLSWQTYTYDPFGNIQSIGGTPGRTTATSTATNRLNSASYDSAGNMTAWNGNSYTYDALGMMTRMVSGAEDWRYMYTADNERIWAYRVSGLGAGSVLSLRDLDGKVLREYDAHVSWGAFRDYVYGDGRLLASEGSQAQMSFTDVPPTYPYAAEIEAMKAAAVTSGCAVDQYCPVNNATRAATIVFIYRARGIVYSPAQCSLNGFAVPYTDVPDTHPFCAYIARAKADGLTGGCGPTTFCPENPVGRGAVAVYT